MDNDNGGNCGGVNNNSSGSNNNNNNNGSANDDNGGGHDRNENNCDDVETDLNFKIMMAARKARRKGYLDLKRFVKAVARKPFLYEKCKTPQNPQFQRSKFNAWVEIGARFNMTHEDAEKKWRVQRDRYNKERKKVMRSQESGSPNDFYASSWDLYHFLDRMLGDHGPMQMPMISDDSCPEDDGDDVSGNVHVVIDCDDNAKDDRDGKMDAFDVENFVDDRDVSMTDAVINKPVNNIRHALRQRKRLFKMESPRSMAAAAAALSNRSSSNAAAAVNAATLSRLIRALQTTTQNLNSHLKSLSKSSTAAASGDKVDHFCAYINFRLKKLDTRDRHEAMKDIESILADKECQEKYYVA